MVLVKTLLKILPQHIGAYLNADELEQNLRQSQRH